MNDFVVVNTSAQGKNETGGIWTRPDFAFACIFRTKYLQTKSIEIGTFKLKKNLLDSVQGVYEAIVHNASAYISYLVSHITENDKKAEEYWRIHKECNRNKVGWIIALDNGRTYEEIIEPVLRESPDESDIENFIENHMKTVLDKIKSLVPRIAMQGNICPYNPSYF